MPPGEAVKDFTVAPADVEGKTLWEMVHAVILADVMNEGRPQAEAEKVAGQVKTMFVPVGVDDVAAWWAQPATALFPSGLADTETVTLELDVSEEIRARMNK